jgi:hypothetical protein
MAGILKLIYLKDYRLLSVLEMDALISASLPGPRRLVTAVASGLTRLLYYGLQRNMIGVRVLLLPCKP